MNEAMIEQSKIRKKKTDFVNETNIQNLVSEMANQMNKTDIFIPNLINFQNLGSPSWDY